MKSAMPLVVQTPECCALVPQDVPVVQESKALQAAAAAAAETGDQLVLLCCRLLPDEPVPCYIAAVCVMLLISLLYSATR